MSILLVFFAENQFFGDGIDLKNWSHLFGDKLFEISVGRLFSVLNGLSSHPQKENLWFFSTLSVRRGAGNT